MTLTLELRGLELQGRHGVEEEERANPQPFLFDLWLDVPDAALSDRIEDAVDYREVADCVRQVSEKRQFHLLEALAAAVADAVVDRFPVTGARVRVRKPRVVLDAPVDYSAATAEASRR